MDNLKCPMCGKGAQLTLMPRSQECYFYTIRDGKRCKQLHWLKPTQAQVSWVCEAECYVTEEPNG